MVPQKLHWVRLKDFEAQYYRTMGGKCQIGSTLITFEYLRSRSGVHLVVALMVVENVPDKKLVLF